MTPSSNPGEPRPLPHHPTWAKVLLSGVAVVVLASCCLLLPCTERVSDTESWPESAAQLRWIGLALRSYHEVYGRLPPAVVTGKGGRPLYSWRLALLPFLEQYRLHQRLKLDEPWDSPHNKALLENTPRCYLPRLGPDLAPGLTRFQVFVGPGTAFERDGLTWDDFPDGPANTILVVEAPDPVPWSKPVDLPYAPDRPLPPLDGVFTKSVRFLCYEVRRKPGFTACFGDGTTRFVSSSNGEETIRALITRNGREAVDLSRLE